MLKNRFLLSLSLSLLCAVGFMLINLSSDQADSRLISIEERINQIVDEVNSEAQLILDNKLIEWSSLHHAFFLIDSAKIESWSSNQFFPDLRSVATVDIQLVQSNSGDFLIQQWPIDNHKKLFSVVTLIRKYPISNRYLSQEWSEEIFKGTKGLIKPTNSSTGSIISVIGKEIFRFQIEELNHDGGYGSFIFATACLIFFVIAIYFLVIHLNALKNYELGFSVLLISFILLRVAMFAVDYPLRWTSSTVFDPQYFASSNYNSSVGDLFINALGVFILCGYIFLTYPHWKVVRYIFRLATWGKYVIGCFFIVAAFFSVLYPFLFVETIFHNSVISLDITESIRFDWLRSLSFLSVLLGAISAFFFVHVFIRLAKSIFSSLMPFLIALVLAGGIFTLYFLNASRDYFITLMIANGFFLILFSTNLISSLRKLTSTTFIYFFTVIITLGVQHSVSIKRFMQEKRMESHLKFASNYLIGKDVLGEYLLNEGTKRMQQDAFIQSRFNNPFVTKSAIRQKVRQVYLNSYFDRYEAQIYLYNAAGEPIDNNSPETLATLLNRFKSSSTSTDYDGIYFIQPSDIDSNKRYVSITSISKGDLLIGFIVLDLSLKRIIPQNVYPELLVDRRFAEFFKYTNRSFSFIKDGKILSSFGAFNYEKEFDFNLLKDSDFYKSGINKDGNFYFGVEDVSGQVAVITSNAYPLFFVLTNFSLFFILSVILIVVAMTMYGFASLLKGYKMNYAARIQLYIYLAFSLPLIVVTITTLNRVSKSAEDELNLNFEVNARNLSEDLLSFVTDFYGAKISREDFENILIERAKITNSDLTFYDREGNYVASSQPLILDNQIVSSFMNRSVWEQLTMQGVRSIIDNERIGKLFFNNCYVPIKSPESGLLLGILSVPFFNSANSLESTQVNVLSNFLTVFTIIFILFSVLSIYIVNSLTFPLRFITRILSRTTLAGGNKQLEWKSNDEIGMMVSEYNKMVHNLEQSKIELARSQKESAWREIAKQVAHEIKNPLTPMKLTLQQMEYLLKSNKLDSEKARTSIETLLTQVDILNEIASSFSTFARMPAPLLTRINLNSLLDKSVGLYSDYDGGEVFYKSHEQTAFVMGDEQLFNRIFSNIILNGLQSAQGNKVVVMVELKLINDYFQISFADNGYGVPPEMINKLFTPHFSTKVTGSGLGLAISKQGIEQSGGEIWFDTNKGEGTTFYIKLPRID